MKFQLLVVVLCLFLVTCTKDKAGPESTTECSALPEAPPIGWNQEIKTPDWDIKEACYLSSTDRKLIYLTTGADGKLFFLDLDTRDRKLIDTGVSGGISVSRCGTVSYFKNDFNIYIVKLNGDSLTQITFDNKSTYPLWINCTEMYYLNAYNFAVRKYDFGKKSKDSISDINSKLFYNNPLLIYSRSSATNQELLIRNLSTNVDEVILNVSIKDDSKAIRGYFMDNSRYFLYYYTDFELVKINMKTKNSSSILRMCDTRRYTNFCINDNDQILAVLISKSVKDSGTLYVSRSLVAVSSTGDVSNVDIR